MFIRRWPGGGRSAGSVRGVLSGPWVGLGWVEEDAVPTILGSLLVSALLLLVEIAVKELIARRWPAPAAA